MILNDWRILYLNLSKSQARTTKELVAITYFMAQFAVNCTAESPF